jgi:glycosyltransferase involved in cell wall biosynthesis
MVVFYFGADSTWSALQSIGFRRRNTCILKALAECDMVKKLFVVRKAGRREYIKYLLQSKPSFSKVEDIPYLEVLPKKLSEKLGLSSLNKRINAYLLHRAARRVGGQVFLWCYWPRGYAAAIESGIKGTLIFDADHNIIDDPNIRDEQRPLREQLLLQIGARARYILSSSVSMIEWYSQRGFKNCVRLRNGVERGRFHVMASQARSEPPKIGYCGTLSKWINYDLFAALVARNPSWQFIIIGKPWLTDEWQVLKQYSNVNFLGEKTASEVAQILPEFDVAVNLYRFHPALDADSMKLYEYIAAGIPTVSTRFHSNLEKDFDGLLLLGDTVEDIELHIRNVLGTAKKSHSDTARRFLEKSTWNRRVNDFISTIQYDNA